MYGHTRMDSLLTIDDELCTGTIVDRPNRFVVRVRFEDEPERVFLGDPGALEGTIEPGHEILCAPVDDPERATDYDAIAVHVDTVYVSVRPALANDLFERALGRNAIPAFDGYTCRKREPALPDHGRTDFRLETPSGNTASVEIKSCTHVEDRIAKFPDRQTERGRRHLRSLEALCEDGHETHVVFVVQRPDVERFRPYRDVDPEFAELLSQVQETGVGVHAITTSFKPPHYVLRKDDLPVDID
ncbi:sugar fermentation stimulation protein [Halogeometricum borinquense DSM 11551]|uniref:Sugar fermentation stimulation protein n=2 Tax=Halogeometricum borinquense TaxID=60847 RepID=E4NVB4_HALBP|nr:sugar fermentation stimulation protein [Halogeometricum borinquense DSM 11551]ELY29396.1 sugar fermentation stimulation protein [Halogeometricum borinquense DSM 11551]